MKHVIKCFHRRNRHNENDRILLVQSIRSGYLHEWLNKMDRQINLMHTSSTRITETSELRLSEAVEVLQSIRKIINDFTN